MDAMKKTSVPERFEKLASLYSERNEMYGSDYIYVGEVMMTMFPSGLTLNSAKAFRRFMLFCYMLGKLQRYAQAMRMGTGHRDSLDDLAVYAQMTAETDDDF